MSVLHWWAIAAAVYVPGVFVWRYTVDRHPLPYETRHELWMRSLIWPLMAAIIALLWLAFRGYPLVLFGAIVAVLFAASIGAI